MRINIYDVADIVQSKPALNYYRVINLSAYTHYFEKFQLFRTY